MPYDPDIYDPRRIGLTPTFVAAFNGVAAKVHLTALSKGWWEDDSGPNPTTDAAKIALMHSELSEALEGVRRPGPDQHCPEYNQVEVELADTIIRIMDFAQRRKLNVAEALVAKAKFNKGRDYRHGGATI